MVADQRDGRPALNGPPRVPWNAIAIVVAGGLIGLGLLLGLRDRQPTPPGPGPAPTADAGEVQRKATAEAQAWLERQLPALVRTCWEPSVARAAEPPRIQLGLNLSFDEQGREVGRGVHEYREAFRSDVGACVREFAERAQISAPGTTLTVDLSISLPN